MCIYTDVHVKIDVYVCVYYIYTFQYTYIYTYIYMYMYTYIYVHVYQYVPIAETFNTSSTIQTSLLQKCRTHLRKNTALLRKHRALW